MTVTSAQSEKFEAGLEYLAGNSLNIVHVFDTRQLSDLIQEALADVNLADYPTTVLTASGGPQIWQSVHASKAVDKKDPIDRFSVAVSRSYAREYLGAEPFFLYPSELPIPLGSIGLRTGWSFQSPMGISIHPVFGTWFAYRTLFMVKTQLPESAVLNASDAQHPCHSCADKPCISACPAKAVGEIGRFGLDQCALYRIADQSPCALTCIARTRCPVGAEHQYLPEQRAYFYRRSRETLQRYYGDQAAG